MKSTAEGNVPGQMLTASSSLVANGLSIAEASRPALLRGSRLHPCAVGEVKPDWITQPEKLLFLPLNPAGQGPTAAPSTVLSF